MLDFRYYVWKLSEGLFFGQKFFFVCATVREEDAKKICDTFLKSGDIVIYTETKKTPCFCVPCDYDGGYEPFDVLYDFCADCREFHERIKEDKSDIGKE